MAEITEGATACNTGGYFISDVTAIDVIEHLNSYLGDFARKTLELKKEKDELQRRYENLRRLFDSVEKQRESAQ